MLASSAPPSFQLLTAAPFQSRAIREQLGTRGRWSATSAEAATVGEADTSGRTIAPVGVVATDRAEQ